MAPYDIRNGDQGIIMEFNVHDRSIINASSEKLVKIKLDRFVNVGNQNDSNWRIIAKNGPVPRPIPSSECYPGTLAEKASILYEIYGNDILDNIIIVPERNVDFRKLWTVPKRGRSKRSKRSKRKRKKRSLSKKRSQSKRRQSKRRQSKRRQSNY